MLRRISRKIVLVQRVFVMLQYTENFGQGVFSIVFCRYIR